MALNTHPTTEADLEDKERSNESSRSSLADETRKEPNDSPPTATGDGEKAEPVKTDGPGPPPDGGLIAWLQCLGGFMLFFNTWGILK